MKNSEVWLAGGLQVKVLSTWVLKANKAHAHSFDKDKLIE